MRLTATKDGERQIDLSWTAPSDDGGANITGYRIEVSEDGSTWTDLVANTRTTITTHSHTGLKVETTRLYRASAINSAGTSLASNVATGITAPPTVPEAPSGLTATKDEERRIDLSWTAPSDDGGANLTGYLIEVSADGSSWSVLVANSEAEVTTHSHTELRGDATRYYRVSAINSTGTGPPSNVATGRTAPATVPEAPSGLTATMDIERRIDLSWTAPSDDGGANITGYRIEVSLDGSNWTDLVSDTGLIANSHSHTGLRGDATHYYRISAINSSGTGPCVGRRHRDNGSPDRAPEPPTGLTATQDGERRIDLSWTSPSDDRGAAITGYRIEMSLDDSNWTEIEADIGATVTAYSHTGLRGGTTSHYRVSAINSTGTGPESNVATGTTAPATMPPAPTGLTATQDAERQIHLSWSPPSDDGGANITGYRIEVSANGSDWSDLVSATGLIATDHSHTGLRGDATRLYRISVINSTGTGPASNVATGTTAPATTPEAPTELTATTDLERRVNLSWSSPPDDGGADITGYRIEVSLNGSDWSDLVSDTGATDTTYSHKGLRGGATLHYRISAINSAGTGASSNIAAGISAPPTMPLEPTELTATTNWEKWIDLSWTTPSDDGGADITGYRIEVSSDGSAWSELETNTGTTGTTYSHMRLKAEATFHYRVSAINSAGAGAASNVSVGITVLSTPATDRAALVTLYNATGGANWANNKNWLSNAPMKDWFGITTDRTGRVNGLSLESNHLSGQIPPQLANLTYLATLNLYQNQLSGQIPPQLGSLSHLEKLALTQNRLTGELPPELGNLSYLKTLHLSQNQLSGEIPPELGNLPYLRTLALEQNQLSGEIPPELANLSSLELLYLPDNQLSGEIPPELGSLPYLELLYLKDNNLSGEIPSELGGLSSLESLNLGGNNLIGCVPWGLGHIENKVFVGHRFCPASDQMSTGNTTESDRAALITLYQATDGPNWKQNGGWLSDAPIGEWFGVTTDGNDRVTGLDLDANWLRGVIPSELGNLSSMKTLSLKQNRLSGKIPPELGNISNLVFLYLSQNQLTGGIPLEVSNLSNLRSLTLSQNRLTGRIPPQLGDLLRLRGLDLSQNQLTGEIPQQLGKLSYLTYLSLFENRLSGRIPSRLGSLLILESLRLNDNRLRGEIPPQLSNLSKLRRLNLEANKLTGRIPPQLGNLFNLQWLSLNNNRFSGEVPPEIGELANLTRLRIGGSNRLAGCIPGFLWNVPHNDFDETGMQPCEAKDILQVEVPATQLSAPPRSLKLDTFYEKYLDADGIPIAASSLVPDEALFQARDIINEMLSDRNDLHSKMARLGVRVAIMARESAVSDLPEFREFSRYWDTRVEKGGLYSRGSMRLTVIGEENLLCQADDVRKGYDVFVHEFAHAIDHAEPFSGFRARLESAYRDAMNAGLWPATYASTNPSEYWAQAVEIWFGLGSELHLNSRAQLLEYDPKIAALIQQVFGDAEISSSCNLAILSERPFADLRSGDLSCFLPECSAIDSPIGVSFYNFSVEVTFVNPTLTERFEYGYTIAGSFQGGVSDYIAIRVTNSRTWRAYISKVTDGSVQVQFDQWRIEIGGGDISVPFDTMVGGSNVLKLIILGDEGCLHANGNLISCFDISGRASTEHIFISSEGGDARYYGLVARKIEAETE